MERQSELLTEVLVLRCQEGDAPAFEDLLDLWQRRLWRYACRMTSEEAAWDVMQEAWSNVAKSIHKLREPSAFPSWVYRIVSNKCRDWLRKEIRRRNAMEEYTEVAERESDRKKQLDEQHQVIREAMERLPKEAQGLITLAYEENFTMAEIAAILDVPEGTIKSRLFHARNRLREIVEDMTDE